jgi:uncharacterized membrane protein (DUF2068 family)
VPALRFVAGAQPARPARQYPPRREEIALPLRGRPLRDRYVLRLIAVDRLVHVLVLSALAVALFLFASNKAALNADFTRILKDLQGGLGGPVNDTGHGVVHDLRRLFAVSLTNLYLAGAAVAAYAVLEAAEAAGLWMGRRWAEYLTFLATVVFVPYELYELTKSISALKVLALVVNLAIVAYLLIAKRLFGLRGGGRAERAERAADTGWAPVERATPGSTPSPAPHASSLHSHASPPVSQLSADVSPASAQPRRG